MEVLSERNILRWEQVASWRKDFDKLIKIKSSPSKSVLDAEKSHAELERLFKTYMSNLKSHIQRDYYAVIDWYMTQDGWQDMKKKGWAKDVREKIAVAFEKLDLAIYNFLETTSPNRLKRYGTYSEEEILRFSVPSKESVKLVEEAADELWGLMRKYIKLRSDDGKVADNPLSAQEFVDFMGLKFVNDVYLLDDELQSILSDAAPWLRKLKKIMPEVFYGNVFLEPSTNRQNLASQFGSKYKDVSGIYRIDKDNVALFSDFKKAPKTFSSTLIHELAHRYYFKFMDASDRQRWKHFFNDLRSDGVSEYSNTNPEEDFAESILHYVFSNGVMKQRDVRDRVEAMLKSRISEEFEMHARIALGYLEEQKMTPREAIDILGLNASDVGDASKVKAAFRNLALANHPDRGGDPDKMKMINQAYEVLSAGGVDSVLDRAAMWDKFQAQRKAWDDKAAAISSVVKEELPKIIQAQSFVDYFGRIMGKKFAHEVKERTSSHYKDVYEVHTFRSEDGKTVFEFSVYVSMADIISSSGLGGGGAVSFPISVITTALHDRRKTKLSRSDYRHSSDNKILLDPSELFPESRLKKMASGKEKARKFSKRDMETSLSKELSAKLSGEFAYIPLDGDFKLVLIRTVILGTPAWSANGIYQGNKRISYFPKTFSESEATIEFLSQLQKGAKGKDAQSMISYVEGKVRAFDVTAESVFCGGNLLSESDEAVDSGLQKKKVKRGKLEPSEDWRVVRMWSVHDDGDPENPDYETCANCGKDIAYCVDLDGPDLVTVGGDCAESLTSGSAKDEIERFLKVERDRTKTANEDFKSAASYSPKKIQLRSGIVDGTIPNYLSLFSQSGIDPVHSFMNLSIGRFKPSFILTPEQKKSLYGNLALGVDAYKTVIEFIQALAKSAAESNPSGTKAVLRSRSSSSWRDLLIKEISKKGQPVKDSKLSESVSPKDVKEMLDGYIEAALWSSMDDEGEPLDKNFGSGDIDPSSLAKAKKDCTEFLKKAWAEEKFEDDLIKMGMEKVGHNFWLNRNGHGSGFWDEDGIEYGDELSDLAKEFPEVNPYVSDDGQVMLEVNMSSQIGSYSSIALGYFTESTPEWLLKIVKNPKTGRMVQVRSLPPEERERYRPKKGATKGEPVAGKSTVKPDSNVVALHPGLKPAIKALRDSGNDELADRLEKGKISIEDAAKEAEDQNDHGVAAMLSADKDDDVSSIVAGNKARDDFDSGKRREAYSGEREGALAMRNIASSDTVREGGWIDSLAKKSKETGRDDYLSGQMRSPVSAMIYMDQNKMQDTKVWKDLQGAVKRHPELFKKALQSEIDGYNKSAKSMKVDADYEKSNPGFHEKYKESLLKRARIAQKLLNDIK